MNLQWGTPDFFALASLEDGEMRRGRFMSEHLPLSTNSAKCLIVEDMICIAKAFQKRRERYPGALGAGRPGPSAPAPAQRPGCRPAPLLPPAFAQRGALSATAQEPEGGVRLRLPPLTIILGWHPTSKISPILVIPRRGGRGRKHPPVFFFLKNS